MCNWDAFTFACGCYRVRLRDRCHTYIGYNLKGPCPAMQCVNEKWRHHSEGICPACQDCEEDTGKRIARVDPDGRPWGELSSRILDEAGKANQARTVE